MPVSQGPPEGRVIGAKALRSWTADLVETLGTPDDIAADVAEVLVASDLRGIASHGTARLPQSVKLVEAGVMDPAARPIHEKGKAALARFDARNGWGHHAARIAIDDAIARARDVGAAISVVRNTNHFGIAGWYAMRAADEGFIGVSLTNASPVVAPTRARVALLGANPIAVAAPAGRYGMLVLDMATATIPRYGLALVVELLTGILGDAAFGPNIVSLFSTEGKSDLGQFFMAIDPGVVDGPASFTARLEKLIDQLTSAPLAADATGPVLYAGQIEAERAAHQSKHGIVLERDHHDALVELGSRLGVAFPSTRPAER